MTRAAFQLPPEVKPDFALLRFARGADIDRLAAQLVGAGRLTDEAPFIIDGNPWQILRWEYNLGNDSALGHLELELVPWTKEAVDG